MISGLSPYRLGKARDIFNIFVVFNGLSWNLLVGSIATLLAMRLGASATYIGTLSALLYVSFFFMPLGKLLVRWFKVVNIFGVAWILRALGMAPVVFAPVAAHMGHKDIALGLTMLGVAVFHVMRGIGIVGNNPVLSHLSTGPDRGSYLTKIQIINSATTMFSGFAIALVLGKEPPLFLYSVIMTAGIICGITSGILIKKVPEPPMQEQTEKASLPAMFRDAFADPPVKRFLAILLIVALVSGVSRTFLVVYAREVFFQDDGMILLYGVFGGLGNLLIGMLIKFLVDRIGAKPLFILCVMAGLVTMSPILFFPASAVGSVTVVILLLAFLFFMLNFGFMGAEGIAQTYFMGLVPSEKMLDMGILYCYVFGIAGAAGSLLAGLLLDLLAFMQIPPFITFKILYAILIAAAAVAIYLQRKLTKLGALSVADAVKVMFSYRDLQAISLLDRLDKAQDYRKEEQLLGALKNAPSQLAIDGLLTRARSPRLATRQESIRVLERLDALSDDAEKALTNDIINNPFTTAYISARILGKHGCTAAIPLLRELVSSTDYMLAGESMIALAKLQDKPFCSQIEQIILDTKNPRLKIMGAEALGIYGMPHSLLTLLEILGSSDPQPYLRDEIVLAMAAILGTQSHFYPILVRFVTEPSLAPALAMDQAEAAFEFYRSHFAGRNIKQKDELYLLKNQAETFQAAVGFLVQNTQAASAAESAQANPAAENTATSKGVLLSRWIQELPAVHFSRDTAFETAQTVFSESLLDPEIASRTHLYLLIVHWAAYQIRAWTKKLRG